MYEVQYSYIRYTGTCLQDDLIATCLGHFSGELHGAAASTFPGRGVPGGRAGARVGRARAPSAADSRPRRLATAPWHFA